MKDPFHNSSFNLHAFLSSFDLLAEAPGGVPKLRELILQLAVRGQLVPQDKGRGKGSVHHEGHEEHEGVDGAGKIEGPYALPPGWRWTTLRSVSTDLGQKVPAAPFTYVDVSAIDKDHGCIGDDVQVLRPEEAPSRARKIVKRGTVIYSTVRPYLLNIAVVDREFDPAPIVSTAFFVMHPHPEVEGRFLFYYLRSQPFTEYVNGAMTGMAYPAVNDAKMSAGPFPLPPLAEQKRIVARVDELMRRCDELEARQKERDERHTALVSSCLHAVADPKQPNPNFIIHPSSFNLLFSSPSSVAELRKTILQLAVQGRLVKQDSNNKASASVLASPITRSSSSNGGKEVPFEVPITWQWIQLGQVCELINGDRSKNYPNRVEYVQEGVPWINTGHIEPDGTLSIDSMHYITRKKFDSLRSGKVRQGDLVYCLRGATLGKTAIITQFDEGAVASSLVIIRLSAAVDPRFAYRFLTSPLGYQQILQYDNGSAQPNLSANNVKKYWFPLPPLAEQRKIVAKVNELMALCDALEAKLTQSRADADTLAAAIVHHLAGGCNAV